MLIAVNFSLFFVSTSQDIVFPIINDVMTGLWLNLWALIGKLLRCSHLKRQLFEIEKKRNWINV